ncbi:MAG: substrate-binding domain-containing protein, partial [Pseudobutyrivibrio sp.]|nr:substrate-binding domain-containing protein [Pseudobutyrivibrio sp.]
MKKKLLSLLMAASMSVMMFAGCGGAAEAPAADDAAAETATEAEAPAAEATNEGKKVGFVTFSTDGDFFQALADTYVEVLSAQGWDAQYENGEFNPEKQINAFENYISMGMDVIVVWPVAPEAMSGVIDQAMEKGIKVVAFVAPTEKYDALMVSDEAELAAAGAKLAAKWIDETYADAPDHSVPVAVFTERDAQTGVTQGDVLMK